MRGASEIHDLEVAVGQYALYRSLIERVEPERNLFLGVTTKTFAATLNEPIARSVIEDMNIALLVFDPKREVVVKWIR